MVLREGGNMSNLIRTWLMLLAASTSISLVDALSIYGKYGCKTNIDEVEASAALLLIQLIALAILLAMSGLSKVMGRFPAQQELAKNMLALFVCAILLKLAWVDSLSGRILEIQEAIPKSAIVLFAIWLITVHVLLARHYLKRGDKTASHSFLSNEHLVLAMPVAMAMVLVAFSETSDRLAFTRWHQPVFLSLGAVLLVVAFIPVKKRRYLLAKSAIFTVACFGIVLAPALSEKMHISSSVRTETPVEAPQHVLLLTVDTLRYDAVSVYEGSKNPTPSLEELAKQSVVFDNAYSTSGWTVPSVSSILSGLNPLTHQVSSSARFDDTYTTISETFAEYGYRTAAIVSNPILFPNMYISDKGFHDYQAFPSKQYKRSSFGLALLWRLFPKHWPPDVSTTDMTDLATRWYDQNQGSQTFLWLHYLDPHDPYTPPEIFMNKEDKERTKGETIPSSNLTFNSRRNTAPNVSKSLNKKDRLHGLYEAEARYTDHEIGRLLDSLKDKGMFDDMLIVFVSDHGEEFTDHGKSGHGHTLYNELIHVPFLIKMPGQSQPVKVTENVSVVDIYPTIVELCDLSVDDKSWDGQSLKDFFEPTGIEPKVAPMISAFTLKSADSQSIIFNGYKLISNVVAGKDELYWLDEDPKELHDIAQEQPEKVEQLKTMLADAFASANTKRAQLGLSPIGDKSTASKDANDAMTQEQQEALEALGYLEAFE